MNALAPAARSPDLSLLALDEAAEIARLAATIRTGVTQTLKRRGAVLGLSGGIDSTVTAALCVAALGANRVVGVLMPECDSDPDSLRLGRAAAEALGIETVLEDIGPALDAAGCYQRRDAFIRATVPDYGPDWKCKIVLGDGAGGFAISYLVVESPTGERSQHRMSADAYRGIIAAANMKQRTRKQLEYFHADRLGYAVAGTPNRLEYDQGFFVKNGDGAADFKPIAHLYKTQVYALAQHFDLPAEIRSRPPTTDTWSLPQSQEEFYFSAPYQVMDVCLFALENGLTAAIAAERAGLTEEQVETVWRDIAAKRKATRYLHEAPLLF
ncbi:NH(3)-dependent NAD(+) synthetase [Alphaproteobacteria bacterium SO-S41]|nr:NH(3)-dependent NAD(+) synthetase [Alphaproteobacteria bacterium SO-S41]